MMVKARRDSAVQTASDSPSNPPDSSRLIHSLAAITHADYGNTSCKSRNRFLLFISGVSECSCGAVKRKMRQHF